MAFEAPVPKYVAVMNVLRERISSGTYPARSELPTEARLSDELGISRPTIVRALQELAREGWVESSQGRRRIVLGVPATETYREAPEHAYGLIGGSDEADIRLIEVGPVLASNRVASSLDIKPGTPVLMRRRVADMPETGPIEYVSVYVPVSYTAGTDIAADSPLPENIVSHLHKRQKIRFSHARETVSARPATEDEVEHLKLGEDDWVLTVLVTALDDAGQPVFTVDSALPPSRHQLEDVYAISASAFARD